MVFRTSKTILLAWDMRGSPAHIYDPTLAGAQLHLIGKSTHGMTMAYSLALYAYPPCHMAVALNEAHAIRMSERV